MYSSNEFSKNATVFSFFLIMDSLNIEINVYLERSSSPSVMYELLAMRISEILGQLDDGSL